MISRRNPSAVPSAEALAGSQVALLRSLVLAVAMVLLTRNVTGRFTGHHDWNSAVYGQIARNHIYYGLGYTKLLSTRSLTAVPPEKPRWYLNHPPLLPVWAAGPMLLFGDDEWVVRTVPIAVTLGSAWLLMVILGRLGLPALGLLTGFFYVVLPSTAYFGRMLDHVAPAQFFSLLMLHGYLQWAGLYGERYRSSGGVVWYVLGTVAGIGTAWAVLLMAGLIWVWHVVRVVGRQAARRGQLFWLTLIPGLTLAAVVAHQLSACGWDVSMFGPLLWTRTLGPDADNAIPWAAWFARQWEYLGDNFTLVGIAGTVACFVITPIALGCSRRDSSLRRMLPSRDALLPLALIALQGAIYVVAFRNRSWVHDYWQFLTAPLFAVALATLATTIYALLAVRWPKTAASVLALLLLIPMPAFARGLDAFYQKPPLLPRQVEVLVELGRLIPPRVPVMTSWEISETAERFGKYVHRWIIPQLAYYGNRPLIHTLDLDEIIANRRRCAAYICETRGGRQHRELARALAERYETVSVGRHHVIALLHRPKPSAPPTQGAG